MTTTPKKKAIDQPTETVCPYTAENFVNNRYTSDCPQSKRCNSKYIGPCGYSLLTHLHTQLCKPHTSQMIMLAIGTELQNIGEYYEEETGDVCNNNVDSARMTVPRLKSSRRVFEPVHTITPARWENVARLLERAENQSLAPKSPIRQIRSDQAGMRFPEGCQTNAALISCSLMRFHLIDNSAEFYNKLSSLVHVTGQVCSMTWSRKMEFLLKRLKIAMFC